MKKAWSAILALGAMAFAIPSGPSWHIVRTSWSNDDLVVTGYRPSDFGIEGDGRSDQTARIQKALNTVAKDGGGTLFLPEGIYRCDGNLEVPTGVTLRGDWKKPIVGEPIRGTILAVYGGRGQSEGNPFLALEFSAGIRNLAFWYPEQSPGQITPYPFTIGQMAKNTATAINITLVNSYQGMVTGVQGASPQHYFKGIYGSPLSTGIQLDATYDIGRLENVHFDPAFWAKSGLPNAGDADGAMARWVHDNGTAVRLYQSDWEYFSFLKIRGYAKGLVLKKSPVKESPNGHLYRADISGCRTALEVHETKTHGYMFTDCRFQGDEYGVHLMPSLKMPMMFHTCRFEGAVNALLNEGSGWVSLQDPSFYGRVHSERGILSVVNGDFSGDGESLSFGDGVRHSLIAGCRWKGEGKKPVSAGGIVIDPTPVSKKTLPAYVHGFSKITRPAGDFLVVATDPAYGADRTGGEDATPAIQKALDEAARKGGGIVFLPGGSYRLNGPLSVPPGVELRGSHDVQHHSSALQCTLRVYHGKQDPQGKAAITLHDGSGLRGFEIHYPEQAKTDYTPYAFAVRGRGRDLYILDLTAVNAYQFVDLATHRCDNHWLDYVAGYALFRGIVIGGGGENGRVHNCHFNSTYFTRAPIPNKPAESTKATRSEKLHDFDSEVGRSHLWVLANLNALVVGDTRNQVMFGNFVYRANFGLHLTSENGKGPENAVIIAHGTDGARVSLAADHTGKDGAVMVNSQLVAMASPEYKSQILMGESCKGNLTMFNSTFWGGADACLTARGGSLILDQAYIRQKSLLSHFSVDGAKITVVNCQDSLQGIAPASVKNGGRFDSLGTFFSKGVGQSLEASGNGGTVSHDFVLPEASK